MSGDVTVELLYPIEAGGETVRSVTLRRPKFKQIKAFDRIKGENERMGNMISELAGLPPSAVDELDAADYIRLSEVIGDFLAPGPPTGGG